MAANSERGHGGTTNVEAKAKGRSFCQRLIDGLDSPTEQGNKNAMAPTSALLELPTEIRQQILYITVDDDNLLGAEIDEQAATLSAVCRTFREDTLWVFKRWTIRRTKQRCPGKGAFDSYIQELMAAAHLGTGRTTAQLRLVRQEATQRRRNLAKRKANAPSTSRPRWGRQTLSGDDHFADMHKWRRPMLEAKERDQVLWQSQDVAQLGALVEKRREQKLMKRRAKSTSSLQEQMHAVLQPEMEQTTSSAMEQRHFEALEREDARQARVAMYRQQNELRKERNARQREREAETPEAQLKKHGREKASQARIANHRYWNQRRNKAKERQRDWEAKNPEEVEKRKAVAQLREAYGGNRASGR